LHEPGQSSQNPNQKSSPGASQALEGVYGGDYEAGAGANSSGSNFLGLGGKCGLSKSNKQAKSNDCIGVPPGMTDSSPRRQDPVDFEDEEEEDDAQNNFVTQAELFKSYAEQNNLFCNVADRAYWFEFGGRNIGRMSLDIAALHKARQNPQRRSSYSEEEENTKTPQIHFQWRRIGRYRSAFSGHFCQIFLSCEEGCYLIGGNGSQHNNLHYDGNTMKVRENMPYEKSFFSGVHHRGRIYTFGGYHAYEKL